MSWTSDEDNFIRDNPDMSIEQLVDALGHPYDSTKQRRYMLCGPRDRPTMCRRDDQERMARWMREAGCWV